MDPTIKFCCVCGVPTVLKTPPGETLPRDVCDACGTVHYRNPRMVVGTLPIWEDKVLLCRRAIEPRHGKWTLPGGFMENGESLEEAALRETREEACARVELDGLYATISVPEIHQVHLFYRARLLDTDFSAGEETLETALFPESEIPWSDMAFHTVEFALRRYFADVASGSNFGLHSTHMVLPGRWT